MLKLKTLLGILSVLCLIGLLCLVALITLVDPSQFKDFIQNKISSQTSYTLKLNGPIYWQLDPNLSIIANDIELLSPKSTTLVKTLRIKKARFEPRFWLLLRGKLWVNTVTSGLDFQFNPDTYQKIKGLNIETFKGDWHYDKKSHQIQVKDFESIFTLADTAATTLTGNFTVEKLGTEPTLQGHFLCSLAEYGKITGTLKIQTAANLSKILSLNGSLHSKMLQIGSLPITDLKTQVDFKEGLWNFDPIEAHVFNSVHQGSFQIDLQGAMPKFSLSDNIESTNINELLIILGNENLLQGKMVAKTSMLSQGNTLQDILRSLNGTAQITLTDGKIKGIELYPLLQHVQATTATLMDGISRGQSINIATLVASELNEWKNQAQHSQDLTTSFRSLETELKIQNEILMTKNFKLIHPDYTIDGHGTFDIAHQQAEYLAHAWLNRRATHSSQLIEKFFKETPLSIQIYGPLNNLTLYPNISQYTNDALKLIDKEPANSPDKAVNPLEKLFGFP